MQSYTDGSTQVDHTHPLRSFFAAIHRKFRLDYSLLSLAMLGVVCTLLLTATGCAAERAAQGAFELAKATGVAVIEKSNLTDTSAFAKAKLNNPKYRVLAGVFNGVILEIGLEGAELEAGVEGSGSGPDKPLTPETLAELRAAMSKDDYAALLAIIARRQAIKATPVAPVVAEPILIPASVPATKTQ